MRVSIRTRVSCAVVVCVLFTPAAFAAVCFTAAEGYSQGALHGQPAGSGSLWDCTNETNTYFNVRQSESGLYGQHDYLYLRVSSTNGTPEKPYNYAVKRLAPVSDLFTAAFSVLIPDGSTSTSNVTQIALGKQADDVWSGGLTLAFNKLDNQSMAYHDGTNWVSVVTGLSQNTWYDVTITGDISAGTFNVGMVKASDGSMVSGLAGTDLSLDDAASEFSHVRLCNEGSSHPGSGSYYHAYADLTLIPEPATLGLLTLGGLAMIRRRRKA